MRCAQLRTALSARLDGEPAGVPGHRLDGHVARCAACREWLERAERLRGPLLAEGAEEPSADWTARLLARLGAEERGTEERGAGQAGAEGPGAVGEGGAGGGRPGQGDDGRTR
ncbi:zf-HC2 domain-containing protein [Kitasatospora sp. NPDC002551]|uniref:zf-HC2 domain-containing protein n=1 Tax=Kitasatospora sp. NPDC002551 TaxID=3154539 RepID=UPI003321C26B